MDSRGRCRSKKEDSFLPRHSDSSNEVFSDFPVKHTFFVQIMIRTNRGTLRDILWNCMQTFIQSECLISAISDFFSWVPYMAKRKLGAKIFTLFICQQQFINPDVLNIKNTEENTQKATGQKASACQVKTWWTVNLG